MSDERELCGTCGGEGVVDSGGQTPWGEWVNVPCPECTDRKEMEMPERERAEQLFSYIHYHSGEKGIDAILAFAREERARGKEKR